MISRPHSFYLYLLILVCVALLAPYAGCHLLITQAPDDYVESPAPYDPTQSKLDHASTRPDAPESKDGLNEIEELLGH